MLRADFIPDAGWYPERMSWGLRSGHMPKYRISVINQEFTACAEHELPDAEAARQEGLRGAIAMGSDRICDGEKMFGAEVSISEGTKPRRRFVVTVGTSSLKGDT